MSNKKNKLNVFCFISEKIFRKTKIRTRLFFSLIIMSIIPLLIIGISASSNASKSLYSEIKSSQLKSTELVGNIIENEINNYIQTITSFTLNNTIQSNILKYKKATGSDIQKYRSIVEETAIDSLRALKYQNLYINTLDNSTPILLGTNLLSSACFNEYAEIYKESMNDTKNYKVLLINDKNDSTINFVYTSKTQLGKELCTIIIKVNKDFISSKLNTLNSGSDINYFICNQSYDVISSGNEDVIKSNELFNDSVLIDKIINIHQNNSNKELNQNVIDNWNILNKNSAVFFSSIEISNMQEWFLVSFVPKNIINQQSNNIKITLFIIIAIAILFAIVLSISLSNSIYSPLNRLIDLMNKAKSGDFRELSNDNCNDELGQVSKNYNDMIVNIKKLIFKVKELSKSVSDNLNNIGLTSKNTFNASENIADTMEKLASNAHEQSNQTSLGAKYMNNLAFKINDVTSDMSNISSLVENTESISVEAIQIVDSLKIKTNKTNDSFSDILSQVTSLNNEMKEIRKITDVIVSISDQTNLLALNAAIEAARAGQAGKGFTVVVEEIKNLADQSKSASTMINKILNDISQKTKNTTKCAENAKDTILEEVSAVAQADSAFTTISESMETISKHMNYIEKSMNEMQEFKDQSVDTIKIIAEASKASSQTSIEVSTTTIEQKQNSKKLADLVIEMESTAKELDNAISIFLT